VRLIQVLLGHAKLDTDPASPHADADAPHADADAAGPNEPPTFSHPCPCCGGRLIIIETFALGCQPRHQPSRPTVPIRIDTS